MAKHKFSLNYFLKITTLIANVVTIFAIPYGLVKIYTAYEKDNNWIQARDSQETLNLINLSVGVSIDYFKTILGNYVRIKKSPSGKLTEYVFVKPYLYFVQAITDSDGNVIRYSISLLDSDIDVPAGFSNQNSNNPKSIVFKLGKTTYSDLNYLPDEPKLIIKRDGKNSFYSQEYNNINPNKTYIISTNRAVSDLEENVTYVPNFDLTYPLTSDEKTRIDLYQKNIAPNTYTVMSSKISTTTLNDLNTFPLGIDNELAEDFSG